MIGIISRSFPQFSKKDIERDINNSGNAYAIKTNKLFDSINNTKMNILYYMFGISDNSLPIEDAVSRLNFYVNTHVDNINFLINQHSNPGKSFMIKDIFYLHQIDAMAPLSSQDNYNSVIKEISKNPSFLRRIYNTSGIENNTKNNLLMNHYTI